VKDKTLVSVVVPTFNSERFLEKCLASVKEQTYCNVEIIVVDNHSTDRTKEIAEKYQAKVISVDAKRSKARNIGAKEAKGQWVFFVDSDMELDASVVDESVKKIKEGYGGVIVPEVSVGEGFWASCKTLEKACYIGDDSIEAARFFKKSVLEDVGGYDSGLEAGEDWDLNYRFLEAGQKVGRVSAFIKHQEGRLSLRGTMLRKKYYGKTLKRYMAKNPAEAKQQLKLLRPAFLKCWRKLAKDPIHALGLLIMKACEFISSKLGYLAGLEQS
jgi:glycosyltransferase involved in cell wall biosynthesis